MEEEIEKDSGRDMTPQLIKDLGMRFMTKKSSRKYRYGLYECQYCNKEFEGSVDSVKRGYIKSCGCLRGDTHGLTSHRFYKTWYGMIQRCTNPNDIHYKHYGARGITVCEEWLDVRNFITWAEETYPKLEGYTLDRINNDGNYEPNNCRWADNSTQILNRGIFKNNKSGFVGVGWHKRDSVWASNIYVNNKLKHIGYYETIEEAVEARDNYIIENNLPHKLSTDYIKDL